MAAVREAATTELNRDGIATNQRTDHIMRTLTLVIALAGTLWISSAVAAQESSSSIVVVIAGGQSRQAIRSMHILDRPNRPGHFYGNAVRRRYYSGTSQNFRRRGR